MSKCVVHMMKMQMSAMGGIESHNQREHKSRKNNEIDYEKSKYNYDTVLKEDISYPKTVKNRIAELNLKKAVRKDAVVYCSFIVSSDKGFFERLGQKYLDKVGSEYDGWTLRDYEVAEPQKYEEFIREGSKEFFEKATDFFKERYGAENVINGTVHFDEATPHMHIGVVPVTKDNRLSAKQIFTPLELKQLQSDFAEQVGKEFDLERGKEGSQAKHLDELTFKVQKRQEQVAELDSEHKRLEFEISEQKAKTSTIKTELGKIRGVFDDIRAYMLAIMNKWQEFKKSPNKDTIQALEYIERIGHTEKFNEYCKEREKKMEQMEKQLHSKVFGSSESKNVFEDKASPFDTPKSKMEARKDGFSR